MTRCARRLTILLAVLVPSAFLGCGDASDSAADDAPPPGASPAGLFHPEALCDDLDIDAIAAIMGGTVQDTNSTDRTIMDSPGGHCQIFLGTNETVEIQVWADADIRFVTQPGSERTPLLEQARVRPIDGLGDRAAALWANDQFDNPANNIRGVAVDWGGVAVNVSARGLDLVRQPDAFVAVARQVRADLGL